MFKCHKGEIVNSGGKEHKVITQVRKVSYLLQIQFDKVITRDNSTFIESSYKTVDTVEGTEIVKEVSYCKDHLPEEEVIPQVVDEIERKVILKVQNGNRRNNG